MVSDDERGKQVVILNGMNRVDLIKDVRFEQRLRRSEMVNHIHIGRQSRDKQEGIPRVKTVR